MVLYIHVNNTIKIQTATRWFMTKQLAIEKENLRNISTFDSTTLTCLTKQWKRCQLEREYSLKIRTIRTNPQNGQLLLQLRGRRNYVKRFTRNNV